VENNPTATNAIPVSTPAPPSVLLDLDSAARFLGLSSWQLRGRVYAKEISTVMVGRKIYFRRATLVRWAERSEGTHRKAKVYGRRAA
jgi:hypothetical protein